MYQHIYIYIINVYYEMRVCRDERVNRSEVFSNVEHADYLQLHNDRYIDHIIRL